MDEILFTPAAVLDFLSNVVELQGHDIHLDETSSGVTITIGESVYSIDTKSVTPIEVDPDTIEEVNDISSEAYDDLEAEGIDIQDSISGGPIKELAKTLMLGGMLRLTSKWLKNS